MTGADLGELVLCLVVVDKLLPICGVGMLITGIDQGSLPGPSTASNRF